MIRTALLRRALVALLFPATAAVAQPDGPLLSRLAEVEARVAALETAQSAPAPLPRFAVFRDSPAITAPDAPTISKLLAIDRIDEVVSLSTVPVEVLGFVHQVRVIGEDLFGAVGLFPDEQGRLDYLDALTSWIQHGGVQPLPEDFGGLSVAFF
jgi:hypothetical protein